jgi:hypothetical protein
MSKQTNAPKPNKTEEQLQQDLDTAASASILSELVHLTALDEKIAQGMYQLVDPAIAAAKAKKPDTRLLRLLVRYSGARNRLLATIHRRPQ